MIDGDKKMTADFNPTKEPEQPRSEDVPSSKEMDILQRDRSELLSAYLDGEVTAAERQQVHQWLESDPNVQCLYRRLLKLRQGIQTLPVKTSEQSAEQTVNQVFTKIKNRSRIRIAIASTGGAVAAMFISALSGLIPNSQSPVPQLAEYSPPVAPTPVMVALNHPIIEIPKAAIASPIKPSVQLLDNTEKN